VRNGCREEVKGHIRAIRGWKNQLAEWMKVVDIDFRCADFDFDLDWKMLPAARVEDDLNH
jgi:hypothetical protein